jgi:hypothetical protein
LDDVLELVDGFTEPFDLGFETHGNTVFIDCNQYRQDAVLKINADFFPLLKLTLPWVWDEESKRLCKAIQKTKRGEPLWRMSEDGDRFIETFAEGQTVTGKMPMTHLAALYQYNELDIGDLRTIRFHSTDKLDWTFDPQTKKGNLYVPRLDADSATNRPSDALGVGENRGSQDFNEKKVLYSEHEDWLSVDPKYATGKKPEGAAPTKDDDGWKLNLYQRGDYHSSHGEQSYTKK